MVLIFPKVRSKERKKERKEERKKKKERRKKERKKEERRSKMELRFLEGSGDSNYWCKVLNPREKLSTSNLLG